MKQKKQLTNRILSLVLALVMVVGLMPMTAYAVTSGSCGEGVNFTINNGTLTITGSGAVMQEARYTCWDGECNSITKIVIQNGVTLPNTGSLSGHINLTTVEYGDTVATIMGNLTFRGCYSLSSFTLREGVGQSNNSFGGCSNLTNGTGVKLVDASGNDKTSFYTVSVEVNTSNQNSMTVKGNLSKGAVADISDQQYTGGEVKPAVMVTWNGQTVSSDNYTVAYSNNIEPGTATVTVTGKEDKYFTGTIAKNFTILEPNYVTGIALQESEAKIFVGSSKEISAAVFPDDATIKDLDWSIADNSVASITPSADGTSCTVKGLTPGSTTLTATAKDGSGEKASCIVTVSYLPPLGIYEEGQISGSSYNSGGVCWFAPRAVATVIPPEGHMISTALDGAYGGFVYFDEDDSKTVYLKRVSDGAMTDAIDLSARLKWDTTAPMGEVQLSAGNFWTQLINKISFGMFFKERQTVTITAEDPESGVKSIQYYYDYVDLIDDSSLSSAEAAARLESAIGNHWKDYSAPIELEFNGKYIIYAKITDNVGNVSYISSNGFVLYSDATSATTSLSTTYKAGEDRDILVALNYNTVKEVKCGNAVLTAADYAVSGDKITLKAEYLDTLAAGDYTITISLNPQGLPYVEAVTNEKPAELTVSLTVNPRQVTVPSADTASFVYDGSEQTYNIASSVWYTVTGNKQTNAGTYTVTVALKDKDNTVWDDGTTEDKTYTFHIAKATYDMSGTKWSYSEAFKYDDKEKTVEVIGLPTGVTVSGYTGNTATVAGNYTAKVTLSYDSSNYNAPYVADLNWKIENNWTPAEYTVSGEGWMHQDFAVTAKDGYLISLTNTANGTWEDALTYSEETADGSVTFYLKNKNDGTISLAKTVTYKLDKKDPTGKVEFVERTGWEAFLNTISFNLFYKDEVTVKVTANDNLSGVARIEYASSNEAKTLNEVKEIADWTEYNGSFGVTKPEAQRFVYFIRITDNAGNVTYLSTDGAQYDTKAPVISGVENGKTYYTTQKITITDENTDTITLNGNPAAENITLEGNKEAAYTIAVTDKAGNTTTVTVTMKPIKELAKATENLGNDNITSDDAPALKELIETLDEWIADPDTSDDGEKETLEQHKVIAEALLKTIEDAAKAVNTENTEKVKDVTAENVTPEDKTGLEKAKDDLEKALVVSGGNYTEDEKKAIEDEIKRIDDALEVIGNVEAAEEIIDKLPENITKNNEDAIKAADDAYNALSDYEKSLVTRDAKKALGDAKAALAELNKPADPNSPATGDNSNMMLWIALLFISGGAVITLSVVDRKRRMVKR